MGDVADDTGDANAFTEVMAVLNSLSAPVSDDETSILIFLDSRGRSPLLPTAITYAAATALSECARLTGCSSRRASMSSSPFRAQWYFAVGEHDLKGGYQEVVQRFELETRDLLPKHVRAAYYDFAPPAVRGAPVAFYRRAVWAISSA